MHSRRSRDRFHPLVLFELAPSNTSRVRAWCCPSARLRVYAELIEASRTSRKNSGETHTNSSRCRRGQISLRTAHRSLLWFSRDIINHRLPASPDVLRTIVSLVWRNSKQLLVLLQHPNADASVLRAAFERSRNFDIQQLVARHPKLRWDPEIRPILLRSRFPEVLATLAEDADPEMVAILIRVLLHKARLDLVSAVFRNRKPELPIALSSREVATLLQSEDQNLRIAAIAHLHRIGATTHSTGAITR